MRFLDIRVKDRAKAGIENIEEDAATPDEVEAIREALLICRRKNP